MVNRILPYPVASSGTWSRAVNLRFDSTRARRHRGWIDKLMFDSEPTLTGLTGNVQPHSHSVTKTKIGWIHSMLPVRYAQWQ